MQVTTQTWTARASGRSATVDVVELFSFRDGLVWQIRVFQQDTHLLMNTLTGDAGMQSATNSPAAPGQPKPGRLPG